jgi:uncharacterized cupin superfamily protein
MPKINLSALPVKIGSTYPAPFDTPCLDRRRISPGDAGGLTQFGAHIMTLNPGAWSSQRHYHGAEDELVYIISGHPTLIDDAGRQKLSPGDVTTHKAGEANGHHMINETEGPVQYLVIGGRSPENDHAVYPDIDLDLPANGTAQRVYQRKNGAPYKT